MKALSAALLLVLLACLLAGEAHVISVDFGSDFLKVAAPLSDQSVDIVLNELSKRKTENYLGFRNGERYIGSQAKSLAARFPLLTVAAVNQLMGVQKASAEAKAFEDMMYEYEIQFDNRSTAVVPVKDAHGPFTVEELYSMFFTYARESAVNSGVISPWSAVVTIPFHASVAERRAILEAARLSRIDILGFLHSTTAAALYYGIRRRGFEEKNVTLVVFDVGTTHTEAGVYRFSPPAPKKGGPIGSAFGTLTTVAVLEDKTLGGRALDLCVAKAIEREAVASMGIQPVLGGRSPSQLKSQFSLLRAANKVREVLSANSNTPFSVEGIAAERDFHSSMTRETYERECAPLFARVQQLAKDVLTTTGLKASQIDAFEMMGGAARTPKIIADVSAVLGRNVQRTLNMDEAAAVGAAYHGIKLSPFYRIKCFQLNERVPFGVFFTVDPPLKKAGKPLTPLRRALFTTDDKIGGSASISLNRTEDFVLRFFEDATTTTHFAELAVTGVRNALERLKHFDPTVPHPNNTHFVRIQAKINGTGLLDPEGAEVIVRYATNVSKTVHVNETSANGTVVTVPKQHYTVRMRQSSRKARTTMTWFSPRERTESEWLHSETKLSDIAQHERQKREAAEAKNNLEGYLFQIKGDWEHYTAKFFPKIDLVKLGALRDAMEKTVIWLEEGHGSSDACTRKEYEQEHATLKRLVKAAVGEPDDEPSTVTESETVTANRNASSAETPLPDGADDDGSQDPGGSWNDENDNSQNEEEEDLEDL